VAGPDEKRVTVLAVDDFGWKVAERIRMFSSEVSVSSISGKNWRPSCEGLVIAAMCYEDEELCDIIDSSARGGGAAWLPIFMDHPFLQVGPLIFPDRPGCYRCFRRRRAQHETHTDLMEKMRKERISRSASIPGGYFQHHASIAAGLAWELTHTEKPQGSPDLGGAGTVLAWNVSTGHGRSERLIGCHRCQRCRPEIADGGEVVN
jgi:bacteriocin biosynthesis cyclodehydratase domain-containing protein